MSASGTIKSFNDSKGWGFVVYEGKDIFVHIKDCATRPKVGDVVSFDLVDSPAKPGQKKADNVTGGTGGGNLQGTVKSFNNAKGWGFIDHQGEDVFVHIKSCLGGRPVPGDLVKFDLEESPTKPGAKVAKGVTGGSGGMIGSEKGKGKGKGMFKGDFTGLWGADYSWGGFPGGGWGMWDMFGYGMPFMGKGYDKGGCGKGFGKGFKGKGKY